MSAFADAGRIEAVDGQAIDEDEFDDAAIIVVEEGDGEWTSDSDSKLECIDALEEIKSQSEYGQPVGSSVIGGDSALEAGTDERALPSLFDRSLSVLVFEPTRILGQDTVMPLGAPHWTTTFAVSTDETAELLEHTATEITDRPSNEKTNGIEREYLADQHPQTISRTLAIQECYREAADALERQIELKATGTVLTVIIAGNYIEPKRRDLSLGKSVASFAYPLALALSAERRVLLVDLVSNDTCLELGLQTSAGIMGIASGDLLPAAAVLATASPQVDLLPYGVVQGDFEKERLLDRIRLATAITTLAREYDLILITATIDDVIENSQLARSIGLAVLAVPTGATSVEEVKAACARLEPIGIKPAGILLLDSPRSAFSDLTD